MIIIFTGVNNYISAKDVYNIKLVKEVMKM